MKRMWNLDDVTVVPIVLSTTGLIPKDLHRSIEILGLQPNIFKLLQKAVILIIIRIMRRFLSQE
ncbi:unnamed protein product [Acanthoscelides obtectus]|uniref:Uncharacterized protein n=1 Tax=Acanthoscelides obtectus TaxID=200917 RepID=A0A9P0PN08_ACAOB|nr:unnamed protein product [Acanthoscelides obtectus]CAK1674023.1 hypothetical protein AOBTE_LOCUS29504 [Acanthoscelides obtectus]